MSQLTRLVLTTPGTAADFKSVCDLSMGGLDAANHFESFIGALTGGNQMGLMQFKVGAVQAFGILTFASTGPTNTQTCSVLNTTFTAVTSGATGNQFDISATPATVAGNLVAAINASSNLTGKVTAALVGNTCVITAVVPGLIGNGLALSAGTLSNVTATAFASGSDGTAYNIDLR